MSATGSIPKPSVRELMAFTEEWRQKESPSGVERDFTSAIATDLIARHEAGAAVLEPMEQYQIGILHERGIGVSRDLAEALKWYRKSADQGLAAGEYAAGLMFALGLGTQQDKSLGSLYLRRSAEHGLPPGQFVWATCLQFGFAGETNLTEALRWHGIAASNNFAPSQYALGSMHDEGDGIPQNHIEAVRLYRLAASQKYPPALHDLGVSYARGTGVEQDFREAAKLYRLAAEQGYYWSGHNLGNAYLNGRGVDRDVKEAAKWLRSPAEHGIAESQYAYGLCFVMEEGIPMDEKEAVSWFKKAAEQNHPGAQAFLGRAYLDGAGIETNLRLAVKFIQASARAGDANGLRCYGGLYAGGTGVARDVVEAYKWFTLGIRAGDDEAGSLRDRLSAEMTREQVLEGILRASDFKPALPAIMAFENRFFPQTTNLLAQIEQVKGTILSWGIAEKLPERISVNFAGDPTGRHHFVRPGAVAFIETNQIPAKLGVSFGLSCEISGLQEHAGNAVEIETVWAYPPMTTPKGESNSGYSTIEPRIVRAGGRCWCLAGYVFEKDYELVPGKWRVEFRYRGKTIIAHEFNVIGN